MTTAQELLTLIETVSPNDTDKLDEIDARVNLYAECIPSVRKSMANHMDKWIATRLRIRDFPQYTRSRDALKYIRPKDWCFSSSWDDDEGFVFKMYKQNLSKKISSGKNSNSKPTEELAELFAIIQAIEWERNTPVSD